MMCRDAEKVGDDGETRHLDLFLVLRQLSSSILSRISQDPSECIIELTAREM